MTTHRVPGVFVEEIAAGRRAIEGVTTSTTLFVGGAARGPVDRAHRIGSFAEFERDFGGLDERTWLGHSVKHFFDGGGSEALVVRLAADAAGGDVLVPGTAPFDAGLLNLFAAGGLVDRARAFGLLCVPGLTNPDTIRQLQAHCHARQVFLLVDPDPGTSVAELATLVAAVAGADAINAAMYFPWVLAADPLQGGALRPFPPCGFVAGLLARTDRERGVWKAPAGTQARLVGARDLAVSLTESERGLLSPLGVNGLRRMDSGQVVVWGSRTLSGGDVHGSEWKYVSIRRLALYIQRSIDVGTQWAVFEPNDEPLWFELRAQINSFLFGLHRQGALAGNSTHEAFFVKCDRGTTTAADIAAGMLTIEIGFAPLRPAEFVVLRIRRRIGSP